jgi:hypothetical protein
MDKRCETCTPQKRNCTLDEFVAEASQPVVMDDFMGVRQPDGTMRHFTKEEEAELGIKRIDTSDVVIPTEPVPLYGLPAHCSYRIVFKTI